MAPPLVDVVVYGLRRNFEFEFSGEEGSYLFRLSVSSICSRMNSKCSLLSLARLRLVAARLALVLACALWQEYFVNPLFRFISREIVEAKIP